VDPCGGDDVLGGCPAAPEVLVGDIGETLIVGIGVDRGHEAPLDPELIVEDLDDRCQAVGGARGVGDDLVVFAQILVVDSKDHGGTQFVLCGNGEDHTLGPGLDVLRHGMLGAEHAGGFDDDIDSEFLPREFSRIHDGEQLHPMASGRQMAVVQYYLAGELAHDGVVLEQIGGHLVVGEVVDRNDLDARIGPLADHPEDRPADPPEPVDGYPGHEVTSCFLKPASFSISSTARAA
jgi:hypothetical protein